MKKNHTAASLLALLLLMMLCGCGMGNNAGELTDEQALSAIKNYCYISNPDLESIVNAGEYPVYWEISSSDEQETVILFRSYTGAQIRYYIDRITGDTSVTEFVPGITPKEVQTDERFNARDFYSE